MIIIWALYGLSAIVVFNSPKLKYMRIGQEINSLGIMNAFAMNSKQKIKIPKPIYPKQSDWKKHEWDSEDEIWVILLVKQMVLLQQNNYQITFFVVILLVISSPLNIIRKNLWFQDHSTEREIRSLSLNSICLILITLFSY